MYERLIASLRICQRMSKLEDSCIMLEDGACDGYPNCMIDLMDAAADAIEKLSADAQPVKHGRWISIGHKLSRICSVCDCDEPYKFADDDANVYDYCPHCGADMRETNDEKA